jgi:hypothetical protein
MFHQVYPLFPQVADGVCAGGVGTMPRHVLVVKSAA